MYCLLPLSTTLAIKYKIPSSFNYKVKKALNSDFNHFQSRWFYHLCQKSYVSVEQKFFDEFWMRQTGILFSYVQQLGSLYAVSGHIRDTVYRIRASIYLLRPLR